MNSILSVQSFDIVENNSKSKEEIPPFSDSDLNEEMHEYTTYWGMVEYAHKDLLSALLHDHSARRYKYLHILIVYAHAESLSTLQYNHIQTCQSVCLVSNHMTCSIKYQIENIKEEISTNIPRGMYEYLHVQIVDARKDILSALLHNHSAHRYKYLHVLIVYAHT